MATPSKTIMELEYSKRMRDQDPIGYAIKEHEKKSHGFFWGYGIAPSKSLPPQRMR